MGKDKSKIMHKSLHSKTIISDSFTLLFPSNEGHYKQISHLSYIDSQSYDFGDLKICPAKFVFGILLEFRVQR